MAGDADPWAQPSGENGARRVPELEEERAWGIALADQQLPISASLSCIYIALYQGHRIRPSEIWYTAEYPYLTPLIGIR